MKLWTSIPSYLWRNTCRRWLEHPISPLSKILVPALLSFLAIIVLSMFAVVESDLKRRLADSPAFTVVVEEFVTPDLAPTILQRTLEEELMWQEHYGGKTFHCIRRPLMSAEWRGRQRVPVYARLAESAEFSKDGELVQVPKVVFWDSNLARVGQRELVKLKRMQLAAEAVPMPEWMHRDLGIRQALAVPIQIAIPHLRKGFHNIMVLRLESQQEVEDAIKEMEGYYWAEGRQINATSALELLRGLERISTIQQVVRSLIVLGCGAILALILGSVAWLEYRQDAYLLALLKSFGTPSRSLLVHMLLENLLLVMTGLLIAWLTWPALYELAATQLEAVGLAFTERPSISIGDYATIVLSALCGCLMAMVPIGVGLRKPPGLTLQ